MIHLHSISREDLLIKLKASDCQITLLKKQLEEVGKDKSYIDELEQKLSDIKKQLKASDYKYVQLLELQTKNLRTKTKNQREVINDLHKKLKHKNHS